MYSAASLLKVEYPDFPAEPNSLLEHNDSNMSGLEPEAAVLLFVFIKGSRGGTGERCHRGTGRNHG
jgi:hypothetical protein